MTFGIDFNEIRPDEVDNGIDHLRRCILPDVLVGQLGMKVKMNAEVTVFSLQSFGKIRLPSAGFLRLKSARTENVQTQEDNRS